jgi:DNA-binding transcriptional regulator YhcF (GntR family)
VVYELSDRRRPGASALLEFYDTVRRAAVLLRERGLIVTVHGRGTYVTEQPPQASG